MRRRRLSPRNCGRSSQSKQWIPIPSGWCCRRTSPSLLGIVTDYAEGYIVSKKAVEQRGDGFKRAPIGTGPFAFASDTPNQSLELVANEAYFRGAPKMKKISYRFIPSDASRDLAFQNGELDVDYRPRRSDLGQPHEGEAAHGIVDVFEPAEEGELHLNITAKPLDDIRVRQAIAYAIDRAEMAALARHRCQP